MIGRLPKVLRMGASLQSKPLRERIAGKWQLPLMGCSAFLFAVAVVSLRSDVPRPTIDEWIAEISSLKRGLLLPEAEALAQTILQDGHYEPNELGSVYGVLADVLFRIESARDDRAPARLANILAKYAQAELLGYEATGDDLHAQGRVYEWLGQPRNALEHYERSLQRATSDPLEVRRLALALRWDAVPTPRAELHTRLDELLASATGRSDIVHWSLDKKVQLLIEEERHAEGEKIVAQYLPQLVDTPYGGFGDYLTALLQYKSNKHDQAELTLRNLRGKSKARDDLHARSGWLLGKVIMQDEGPQRPLEAITFFQDVLDAHARGEYVTASRLGLAEALTGLQRYDEALQNYQAVLDELKSIPQTRLIDRKAVRNSLTIRSRLLHEGQNLDQALAYLQLATNLVDLDDTQARSFYLAELASLKEQLARRQGEQSRAESGAGRAEQAAELRQRSQELFSSSAEDYMELSRLQTADESRAAAALWRAAAMYDSAGYRERTVQLLEDFLRTRPSNDQIPMALFKLGQAHQADGQFQSAVERYQECIREYPRTTPAYESYIPLADCFVLLGSAYTKQAEETLLYVLDEPSDQPSRFTPDSYIYREAMFKLGELYSRSGRNEEAIQWLDEALQRYPDDPRLPHVTFLLANAYRQSGLDSENMAAEVNNALQRETLRKQKQDRLRRAEELFGDVVAELSREPAGGLAPMQALQLKLSYTFQADCAFDLGEHERALGLYQEVARVFEDDPVALAAYVQIINSYESLGRVEEIKPALERAHWLIGKIDPHELESQLIHNSADEWHKLFAWIADTAEYN